MDGGFRFLKQLICIVMKYSHLLIPTLREEPAEAEVISHQLMLRAGMIRKVAAGIYDLLPLGLRVIQKVEAIIREEMNAAGAQEVLLPSIQPSELWRESGRWDQYGKELLRIRDRHDREFCYGPTHEEVVTDLVRREVRSYRQLPLNLYQIQTKFRDEIRPRFGVMRAREFIMKDAYSFDVGEEESAVNYRKMYDAYTNIFTRCGLEFRAVEADTGQIGGSFSHEFMVLADSGEDQIAYCDQCEYAANMEKAETLSVNGQSDGSPTQDMKSVDTPDKKSVNEVSEFLGVTPKDLVKTLIYSTDSEDEVCAVLIRGDHDVNESKLKRLLSCDNVTLAEKAAVEKMTQSPIGFAGPIGLQSRIIADYSVQGMFNFVTGGNKADTHLVNVNLDRDFKVDQFGDLRFCTPGDPCPKCKKGKLSIRRGIEVGHVFRLGIKYSQALKATFLDSEGNEQLMVMGCYGIGVGRTAAASIEQNHDENGIIWPYPISPFEVIILPLNTSSEPIQSLSESIYRELTESGFETLVDDREERPGVKFKDADLIGFPIQVVLGEKNMKQGKVEIKIRATGEKIIVPKEDVLSKLQEIRDGLIGKTTS